MSKGIQGEAAGPLYPKINTVWKRNRDTKKIVLGDFAMEELEYLADVPWWWFEKVDGTNIRLHWDGHKVLIGGRTNNALIPGPLHEVLRELIGDSVKWAELFGWDGDHEIPDDVPPLSVTIYGEGYGAGIQSGGAYGDPSFIVFDVRIGNWWLKWEDVQGICASLGFDTVPFLGEASLMKAVHIVQNDQYESHWPGVVSEGLVGRPRVELCTRRGDRLITKIKRVDYAHLREGV